MDIKVGSIVRSIAGHDKGSLLLVVAMEKGYAYVADGKRRKIEKPKKKKTKVRKRQPNKKAEEENKPSEEEGNEITHISSKLAQKLKQNGAKYSQMLKRDSNGRFIRRTPKVEA